LRHGYDALNRCEGDDAEKGERRDHTVNHGELSFDVIKDAFESNNRQIEQHNSSSDMIDNEALNLAITDFWDQIWNGFGEQQHMQNTNCMDRLTITYLWEETQNSPGEQQPRKNSNYMEGQDQLNRRPAPDASSSRRVERGGVWSQLCCKEAVESGEKKLSIYQEEFEKYKEKDVDGTIDAFKNAFVTTIEEDPKKKGVFEAISQAKEGGARYVNTINTNNGEISGSGYFKMSAEGWYLSEVVFNQFQLIMQEAKKDIASFDLKSWRDEDIDNEPTKRTVELFLPAGTNELTFKKGSQEFIALAGTQTAQSKFYLLAQHQKAFGKKEVTSITVKQEYGLIDEINYRYD
jgi:hypothetical protein